jgi:ribonuclease HI
MTNKIAIYVDGSFKTINEHQLIGSAYVVVNVDGSTVERKVAKEYEAGTHSRNITGELNATYGAIAYALQNNLPEITIYHDYVGIAEWANLNWKANKPETKQYANYVNRVRNEKGLIINFIHVKGHSGNMFNEVADKLAGEAIDEYAIANNLYPTMQVDTVAPEAELEVIDMF